jgi:hypothetical protein
VVLPLLGLAGVVDAVLAGAVQEVLLLAESGQVHGNVEQEFQA